jgi:hypothetical protein
MGQALLELRYGSPNATMPTILALSAVESVVPIKAVSRTEVKGNLPLTVHYHGALGVSAQGEALTGASSGLSSNIVGCESGAGRDSRAVLCPRVVGNRVRGSSASAKGFVSDE